MDTPLVLIIIVIIAIAGYFLYSKSKATTSAKTAQPVEPVNTTTGATVGSTQVGQSQVLLNLNTGNTAVSGGGATTPITVAKIQDVIPNAPTPVTATQGPMAGTPTVEAIAPTTIWVQGVVMVNVPKAHNGNNIQPYSATYPPNWVPLPGATITFDSVSGVTEADGTVALKGVQPTSAGYVTASCPGYYTNYYYQAAFSNGAQASVTLTPKTGTNVGPLVVKFLNSLGVYSTAQITAILNSLGLTAS